MTHNLNIGYYTKFKKFLLLLIALLHLSFAFCLYASVSSAAEDKPIMPPYRPAGVIPGTSLTYDKLFIDDKGAVSITIINPENSGVNFTSSFTFYNSKGEYLTGFTIEGSSPRNSRKTYNLHLNNYKKMKTAFYMKVLGRSGGPGA